MSKEHIGKTKATLYFDPETIKELKKRSIDLGKSYSDLAEIAIRQWLEKNKAKPESTARRANG